MEGTMALAPNLVRALTPFALLLVEAGLSQERAVDLATAIFSGGIAYALEAPSRST